MKVKILLVTALILMIFPVLAASAMAQQQGDCGTIVFTLTPNQGQAGSQVVAEANWAYENDEYDITWDTTSGPTLASGTTSLSGTASATITIPADATVGTHTVFYNGYDSDDYSQNCPATITVTETPAGEQSGGTEPTVQQDAYPAARTTLPSTGAFLLPVAGLLAAGAGMLLARRRR